MKTSSLPSVNINRFEYSTEPDAPRRARRFVRKALRAAGYTGDAALVQLLASELVTNSIQHGRPPFVMTLLVLDGVVDVAIEDTDPDSLPIQRPPSLADDLGNGGRGLVIVDALADEWGCDVRPTDGKSVWFRLGPG